MRVLVVPDKFKGTLRADEAARAIADGWRASRPHDTLELLPMSDGGDGFGPIIGDLLHAARQTTRTVNAAHEPIDAAWWWSEKTRTAIVESANVIGLAMLPAGRFHPFELDTLGLGQILHHIAKEYPNARLIIGIGGSATNDAGFGLARGLGYRFLDTRGHCLDRWVALDTLLHIHRPESSATFGETIIATDVQNRLLGPEGASRIYGPQKGLRPEDFPIADKAFTRLTEAVRAQLGLDRADEPGTGAAGGLGYGLRVFLDGKFEPGFDIFARLANLDSKIAASGLVITAEGAIDAQTEMGKGTGAIAALARKHKKQIIGLAGHLPEKENRAFDLALAIAPELTSLDEAKGNPAHWLEKLAALAATKIPTLAFALLAFLFTACGTPQRAGIPSTPESRAIAFLAREVPAWSRDNGCYSCHNNGDGARALFAARASGFSVPKEALADTLAWLKTPESWDKNKGDPGFSDQRLADIQFSAALLAAFKSRLIRDGSILEVSALRLLPHQDEGGAWNVEPQNPAGSPVTYGTALATYLAWKTLTTLPDHRNYQCQDTLTSSSSAKAARWLTAAPIQNIPAAAALLLFALDTKNLEKQSASLNYLRERQLSNGGWGPYPLAPAENFDTALVLLALSKAIGAEETLHRGRACLIAQQNADGSWPATTRPSGGESYAQQISTTAWATLALLATADSAD